MIKGCTGITDRSDEVKRDVYRLQPVLSVGVMGEPKLCRYLTKDKPGKPSKVQLAMHYFFGGCW